MIHFKETQYGFEYGSAEIKRLHSDEKSGWVVMDLVTAQTKRRNQQGYQIYVTKTGKVRVFGPDGIEWKPCNHVE